MVKRLAVAVLVVLAACSDGGRVAQTLTFRARGLYLGPSELTAPDGALSQADNVVISRDGIIETRRGQDVTGSKALTRIFGWKDALVGHGSSMLSRSADSGATWTDYSGSFSPPTGYPVRAIESASNLFFTASDGVKRIDALAGTPEAAGAPEGLDVSLSLSTGSGTALPTDNQAAYRVVFGKKDANGRLLLGGPSGRATIANTSGAVKDIVGSASLPQGLDASYFVQVYRSTASGAADIDPGDELGLVYEAAVPQAAAITQLARSSNVVTATAEGHGYATGTIVRVGPGGQAGSGVFAAVGASAGASSTDGETWTDRMVPAQTYFAVTNGGGVFVAVGGVSAATSPDGITWTERTIPVVGSQAVAWNGAVFAAVGDGVCATSPDGITWTERTIPAGTYRAIAWNGSVFAAVGSSVVATSPDGITWTGRTIPAGTYFGVAWDGSAFVAVGNSVAATSPDGITWTARSIPAGNYRAVSWNGSLLVAVGIGVAASSPDGITWTSRSLPAGNYYSVAWSGSAWVSVGFDVAASSGDGVTWTPQTIPAGNYFAVSWAGACVFAPGEYAITVTGADTFTYAETGADGTLVQAQTATPLTVGFTDTVPDGFTGAALYTNENQDGILNANARPPLARDLAEYREHVFYAHVTTAATARLDLLGVGGTNGLAEHDTVTINGLTYTAKAAESIGSREFQVFTTGTPAQNIRDTAASLVRVVNRSLSTGVTILDVSDPDGVPGQLQFTASDPVSSLTVAVSRSTAWSPAAGISETPKTYKNGIVWSKQNQPDHVAKAQILAPLKVGADDKEILRITPTRSSLFIWKEDGLFRLTGDAGVWDVQPFDPTARLVAAETAVPLDNTVFALVEQGVVRASDTGVTLMSRQPGKCDIEPVIQAALAPAMRATTAERAFAVGYESDHKYLLWLPEAADDTQATNAYVYDIYTQAWTRRDDNASHGFVNPADDRLYLVDGTDVWQERKTGGATDLADRSYSVTILSSDGATLSYVLADASNVLVGDALAQGSEYGVVTAKNGNTVTLDRPTGLLNGAATSYRAISTATTWAPKFGGGPFRMSEFQEVVLFFDSVYFSTARIGFRTNLRSEAQYLPVLGSDYGWTGEAVPQFALRAWPHLEQSWGSYLNVSWTHAQAWSSNSVSGLSVTFTRGTSEVSR